MKKWKSTRFITLLLFSASLVLSCFISIPVSALNFGATGTINIYPDSSTWARYYLNNVDYVTLYPSTTYNPSIGTSRVFTYSNSGGTLGEIHLTFSNSYPTHTLQHFSIRYSGTSVDNPIYYKNLRVDSSRSIINVSCTPTREITSGTNTLTTDMVCDYWLYSDSNNGFLGLFPNVGFSNNLDVTVSPIDYAVITSDSGGSASSELQTIINNQQNIETLLNNDFNVVVARLQDIIDGLGDFSTAIDGQTLSLNNSINNVQQEVETGNQQAQDRWEQDKEEEADREEQGSDDMSSLTSIFRFEIRNPFMGLLGLFTNNCPVNIPVVAGMLGSSQTVYPCWFSQQTRGILTPVIGISSSMLLFGYLVRKFLNGSTFNDTMEF